MKVLFDGASFRVAGLTLSPTEARDLIRSLTFEMTRQNEFEPTDVLPFVEEVMTERGDW